MNIRVNTASTVTGGERLVSEVETTIQHRLGRFADRLTTIEVHLSDDNGQKTRGDDKRCLIEARPAGRNPSVASHLAATLDQAVEGAVAKMERILDSDFNRTNPSIGSS